MFFINAVTANIQYSASHIDDGGRQTCYCCEMLALWTVYGAVRMGNLRLRYVS